MSPCKVTGKPDRWVPSPEGAWWLCLDCGMCTMFPDASYEETMSTGTESPNKVDTEWAGS